MEHINTLSDNQEEKELILKNCGVSVINEFENDIESYPLILRDMKNVVHLNYNEFIIKFGINIKDFDELNTENVGEKPLEEIYKTYKFLNSKFNESIEDLEYNNFSLDEFLISIVARLIEQVIEAGNSERKLKNGNVLGLSKLDGNGFEFIEVPYYAFACTNVSLDLVKVKNNSGDEFTLRQIDTMLGSKNSNGDFFLPNSLGVSVLMLSYNEDGEVVFVSQERNNATTLTQINNKYVASASGAIDTDSLKKGLGLNNAIDIEIEEELGINSIQLSQREVIESSRNHILSILDGSNNNENYGVKQVLELALKSRFIDELGTEINIGLNSGTIGVGLVMEERRNPEVVFIASANKSIEYIENKWVTAKDKDESLSIKGITYKEIQDDLEMRKKGITPLIDNHFYMSYLGYLLKGNQLYENSRLKV